MPVGPDGSLIPFTAEQISAMRIRTFNVRDGSHPVHTREVDQNTMTRTFLVDWAQKENFVELVCGRSKTYVAQSVAGTLDTYISRLLPDAKYGRLQGAGEPDMFATKIPEMRGHGAGRDDSDGVPAYEDAEISVFYEQPTFRVLADHEINFERDRFVCLGEMRDIEPERVGPFPGGAFKYTTSDASPPHGTPIPYGINVLRPVQRFTLYWEQLPYGLYQSSGALYKRLLYGSDRGDGQPDGVPFVGTVNAFDIDIPDVGRWGAGKLLLESARPILQRRQQAQKGSAGLMWRMAFNFAYAPRGWLNMLLWDPNSPATSNWYPVSNDGLYYVPENLPDRVGIYNTRGFAGLFNPNYVI